MQRDLSAEDFASVVETVEAEAYEGEYKPHKPGFPGLMVSATTLAYGEDSSHPFSGVKLNPAGYPGIYLVTMMLRRQGASDNPKTIQMDERVLEGDSHLHFPEKLWNRVAEGAELHVMVQHRTQEGELLNYYL
ncbi:MAG: hypothetical protein M3475_04155, partial [Actinomycetota bacterium]|nr:hypothetical protein [Actinomycetota bacterium]